MDLLDRIHRRLAEAVAATDIPHPPTIADVYQRLIPYRAVREELGVHELAEYELALLRLLAGERDYAEVDSADARDEFRAELDSPYPIVGIYRDYAGVLVRLAAPVGAAGIAAADSNPPGDETVEFPFAGDGDGGAPSPNAFDAADADSATGGAAGRGTAGADAGPADTSTAEVDAGDVGTGDVIGGAVADDASRSIGIPGADNANRGIAAVDDDVSGRTSTGPRPFGSSPQSSGDSTADADRGDLHDDGPGRTSTGPRPFGSPRSSGDSTADAERGDPDDDLTSRTPAGPRPFDSSQRATPDTTGGSERDGPGSERSGEASQGSPPNDLPAAEGDGGTLGQDDSFGFGASLLAPPSSDSLPYLREPRACFACRAPIPDLPAARFCPNCGADQTSDCAGCGAPLSPEWRFCVRCGAARPGVRPR